MRLLLIQSGPRAVRDNEGNVYVNSNSDRTLWERYRKYCGELRLLLRGVSGTFTKEEALAKFSRFDESLVPMIIIPDIYRPRINFFNMRMRAEAKRILSEEIMNADRIIIRTPGMWPSTLALKLCRKFGRSYLIEAVEFAFDLRWYSRNPIVRLFAPYAEAKSRKEIARAPYVSYVTSRKLQERYPTNGKSLGCSDVELAESDSSVMGRHKAANPGGISRPVIFGTAAGISRLKGQEYVIRAIHELEKRGITNIEYHLAGADETGETVRLAETLGLGGRVKFFGPVPHDKIFDWYDSLDVYIQPSMTEALCRALIEAMSRALPIACSDAGGNSELASGDMLFKAGNVKEIAEVMVKMLDPEIREREAIRSFTKAQEFEKRRLDPIRDKFYMDFMKGN